MNQSTDAKPKPIKSFKLKDLLGRLRYNESKSSYEILQNPLPNHIASPPTSDSTVVYSPPHTSADIGPSTTVFGVTIEELYFRTRLAVPDVARQCMAAIEKFGLDLPGIYRQTENLDRISRMMADYEQCGWSRWTHMHLLTLIFRWTITRLNETSQLLP